MNLQTHIRKKVQMHMTTEVIAEKLAAKAKNSKVFANNFSYDTSYFATLNNNPIIMEGCVDCEFTKHVNNDGKPCQKVLGKSSIFEQAFFYETSAEKFLLVDLQWGRL